jgi:starch synthase
VPQKGPEFIADGLAKTVHQGGSFLLLGSSSIPEIRARFEKLQHQHKDRIHVHLEHNEKLAHQAYAALDFLLVPSHFEPCGLTQMIAMRYGTLPIVHATGGLQDTVFDPSDAKHANGFVFKEWTLESFNQTMARVFKLWHEQSPQLKALQKQGMQTDFGWEKPAEQYLQLFTRMLAK